jgi:hypothetical protein
MTEQEIKLQCLELAVDIASQSEESIDIDEVLDDADLLFDFVNSKVDSQKDTQVHVDPIELNKPYFEMLRKCYGIGDDELLKDLDFSHNHDLKFDKLMKNIDRVLVSLWDDELIKGSEIKPFDKTRYIKLVQKNKHSFRIETNIEGKLKNTTVELDKGIPKNLINCNINLNSDANFDINCKFNDNYSFTIIIVNNLKTTTIFNKTFLLNDNNYLINVSNNIITEQTIHF